MCVAAADDQRQSGKFDAVFFLIHDIRIRGVSIHGTLAHDGMDMPFDVVHADQRQLVYERQRLRVCDADQERSDQAGTLRDGNRLKIFEPRPGLFERQTDGGHDGAQVLARGEFGNHAAVFGMRRNRRTHHRGTNARAILDNSRSGFVAGGFNAENTDGRQVRVDLVTIIGSCGSGSQASSSNPNTLAGYNVRAR